ncbi:YaaL family protein [Apilactobacillus quenuiae]|uniref:YaaL family protein n=1 Tax=Apilactobacillus quenuiae TaxID=2008377 RepID=UPI000D01F2ED|nr:YaaL family protein [Apilactobacillus quenuiae]
MLGFRKGFKNVGAQYDEFLLDSIDRAKDQWDKAQETEQAVSEIDEEIIAQTQLSKAKYLFLYREARERNVHNNKIQSSVIDY